MSRAEPSKAELAMLQKRAEYELDFLQKRLIKVDFFIKRDPCPGSLVYLQGLISWKFAKEKIWIKINLF